MVYMNAFYLTSTCVFSIRETWLGDIQQRASLLLKLDLFYKHNWNPHDQFMKENS